MAPIGYLNVEVNGKNEVIIDKMREPFIRKAFEMRLTGASLSDITREMYRLGLSSKAANSKLVSKSTIENMFKNPFYYGIMKFGDFVGPHKYPTHITKNEYDEIQHINSSNSTQKV